MSSSKNYCGMGGNGCTVLRIVVATTTVNSLHFHSAFDQDSFKPSFTLDRSF